MTADSRGKTEEQDHKPTCPHCKAYSIGSTPLWLTILGFVSGLGSTILSATIAKAQGSYSSGMVFLFFVGLLLFVGSALVAFYQFAGCRQYLFLDTKNDRHVHERLFAGGYAGVNDPETGNPLFISRFALEINQPIAGGRKRIWQVEKQYVHQSDPTTSPAAPDYRVWPRWRLVKVCAKGKRFKIRETRGSSLIVCDSLDKLITWLPYGDANFALEAANAALEQVSERAKREHTGVTSLSAVIENSKETLGRSLHAQFCREQLEKIAAGHCVTKESVMRDLEAFLATRKRQPADVPA
ncbi:MAG: hypothetical protein V1778_01860 [bacterium]